jgi:hypothetical protein
LIPTLSGSSGYRLAVLQRLDDTAAPQVGFVHADLPDYPTYLARLNAVAPDFATFASIGPPLKVIKPFAA